MTRRWTRGFSEAHSNMRPNTCSPLRRRSVVLLLLMLDSRPAIIGSAMTKLTVLGAGKMGEALVAGLLASGGGPPDRSR